MCMSVSPTDGQRLQKRDPSLYLYMFIAVTLKGHCHELRMLEFVCS